MMRALLSLSVMAVALLGPQAAAAPPRAAPFLLALVRDDGVMLPIAAHDRGRWRMPWPLPAKEADVPVRLEDCPLAWWGLPQAPREWTLHVPGESPRPITADRMTWVQSYCKQQVAIHSRDGTRPLLRMGAGARAPKYGVAVAGKAAVTLPRAVSLDGGEARTLLDALQPTFNREERMMLALDYFAVFQPSVQAGDRDRMPVRALSISAGPGQDGPTYFVELTRSYPRRSPEHLRWCDEVTYMSGWVRRRDDDSLDLVLVTRAVTSCLLDTTQRAEPHAIVDTPRGPVWMLEMYRPDLEVVGMFLAPTDEAAAPILIREIGRCVGEPPPLSPSRGLPDVSVP
jgi:hypothetical protein